MYNGLPRTTLSYSGDALRSFNVQPTSQLRRDVRKRLFTLRIWSPRYKHVNKGNSNVKQSFDHSVTVRKYVPGVKLGVINCQSISGKLDFVFDLIKEYQLDIVALTETWLSSEDSKNKHVIDQCVAHGYSLHHLPRTSGRRGGGVGLLVSNAIKVTFNPFATRRRTQRLGCSRHGTRSRCERLANLSWTILIIFQIKT